MVAQNPQKEAEFAYLEKQIQAASQQLDKLDEQESKLKQSVDAVQELAKVSEPNVRVPIVDGVYAQGKITNTQKLYVDIGADTVVEKTVDETISLLNEQLTKTQEYQEKVSQRLMKLSKQLDEINQKE